jgi:hypothetical protein
MAPRRKRPRRGRAARRRDLTASARGCLRVVVAANPGSDLTVAPEVELIKAALLYGDRVVVISPATTMLRGAEALERFSLAQQIDLVRQVAPYLLNDDEAAKFLSGVDQMEELSRVRSPGGMLVRGKLMQALAPMKAMMAEAIRDLSVQSGLNQLEQARSKSLVEIDSTDPGHAVDLLAACVISARLAETGAPQSSEYVGRMVETFVGKLARHLSEGRDYLVFDSEVAGLVDAAVREGLFQPAKGPAGRNAQAMSAAALMGRLPTFPGAEVDELLDIRDELSQPLTQFRGAMVGIARDFTSEAWERGFEDEVHDAWVGTVHPALESIEAAVQDNRSLLSMASGVVGGAKASAPGLAIVGAGLLGAGTVADVVGGALSGAAPLLQALRDQRRAEEEIRIRPFYFLYGVQASLEAN